MSKPKIEFTHEPIPTYYNNHYFRSRLEARWAVFFDSLKIKWFYEHEGYVLEDGKYYLPDFWLPEIQVEIKNNQRGLFVEVKGNYAHYVPRAINDTPVVVLAGNITEANDFEISTQDKGDANHCFLQCTKCGNVKVGFSNGYQRGACKCTNSLVGKEYKGLYSNGTFEKDLPIYTAFKNAMTARFEHGEKPFKNL